MLQTTYALSVISTPIFDIGEPIGPMENGMTYIVRPAMQPRYSSVIVCLSSSGATQLLVGPASSRLGVLMKVRFSTRATSLGSERKRKEFGRCLRGVAAPLATISDISRSYSALLPSHQYTSLG